MRLTNKPVVGLNTDDHDADPRDADRVLEGLGLASGKHNRNDDEASVLEAYPDDLDDGELAPSQGRLVPANHGGAVQAYMAPAAIRRRTNSKFAQEMRQIVERLASTPCAPNMPRKITVAALGADANGSSLCASLAVTCSAGGYQVLLVDGNIERPRLHELFGVNNKVGLSNLLGDRYPPNHLPQATSIPNLALISAGPRVSNHASLLLRERVLHRLDPIARAFDFIILDCTGLAPALVARSGGGSDNVIVAVKRHKSSIRALQDLVGALGEEGVENPSVVMIE
jgi:Mrp family chromosome partitioning ATPase